MKLINALIMYHKLNKEQKTFVRNQGINTAMSIPKWIKFLEPLCKFDEVADAAKKTTTGLLIVAGIATFISLFIAAAMKSLYLFPICVTVFLACAILRKIFSKLDVNNNIRNVVYPLLHALALEVGHKKKVTLAVDFNKKLHKRDIAKIDNKSKLFKKNKSVFYDYDVLELNCCFLDGTKLTWKVKDTVRDSTRTNSRGKTKNKEKLKRRILIALSFSKKVYSLKVRDSRMPAESGAFKQSDDKISFKQTIKQSAPERYADIEIDKVLNATQRPFNYLGAAA